MRHVRSGFGLICLCVLLAQGPALAQGDFRWEGALAAGKSLEVKGVSGDVRAFHATDGPAVVEAMKRARRSDPGAVHIEVVEHADGVTICAVYPTRADEKPNVRKPGGEGRLRAKDDDTRVDFTVRLPRGVRFVGRTVNGGVEATGLQSDAEAHTVNGDIELRTSGEATAQTVNGSIRAGLGRVDSEHLSFKTVNGGITVALPDGVTLDVEAETVNGYFSSELPITIRGGNAGLRWGPRRIRGTIGGGGPSLELKTVNGTIRLTRG